MTFNLSTLHSFNFLVFFCIFAFQIYFREMRIVDTKGQLCPAPLIATKRALKETAVGESIIVLTDNEISFNNLSRFLKDNNTSFNLSFEEGVWSLTVTKTSGDIVQAKVEEYCTTGISHFEKGDFIIVLASDRMGEGDDELGHLLMSNFIKAVKDLDKLPQKILFYNKGVTLATNNSPVIDHLKDLEKMGVEMLICATCISHFKLDNDVGIGVLSNMFVIAEEMSSAGNIVRP
jgi:selenium metabolism protein YedF